MAEPPSIQDIVWPTKACDRSVGGGAVHPVGGALKRRRAGEPVQKAHWTPQGRRDAWISGREVEEPP